ncbi:hypothetical protein EVAR_82206_1 [Eumeta japonica]|uniref:Uncharacterized protein n=1 Tax=Eumeta variegata TaxID=151549 RepID=A0A4C1W7W2_EUMVA|nr:hypothetical protein EVAR_82206_1 [Eumeta japonica]
MTQCECLKDRRRISDVKERFYIPTQETGNALMTPLGSRVSMGGGDRLPSGAVNTSVGTRAARSLIRDNPVSDAQRVLAIYFDQFPSDISLSSACVRACMRECMCACMCVGVCVCVRERESECVCVREKERECV